MRSRLAACRETLQPRAVDQEDVQPSVIVVVVEGDTAAGGFEQVLILVLAAVNRLCVESRLSRDIQEADPKVGARRRFCFRGTLLHQGMCTGSERTNERQHSVE